MLSQAAITRIDAVASFKCAPSSTGLVTFAIDPEKTIDVEIGQSFVVAVLGSPLVPWQMTPSSQTIATLARVFTITNSDLDDAEPRPLQRRLADGPTIQYFLFDAKNVGATTITFTQHGILRDAPDPRSVFKKTYTVVVKPSSTAR